MLKSQFSVLKSLKSHKIFHLQIMFPLKPPFLHASPSYKPPFNWGFPNFWPQIHLRWRPVSQHAFGASCAHRCRNLQRWPGLCCTLRCRCRCFWWQGQNKKPWNMHVSIHRFAHMEVRRVFFPGLLQSQYRSHNFLELRANTSFPRNSMRRTVTQLSMWGTIKYVMVTVKWRTSAESLISTWSNVRWIRHRPLFCFNSPSQASTQTFSPQAYRPILNAGQTCYASWHLGRWSLTLPGWNSWQEVSDPHGPHSQTLIVLPLFIWVLGSMSYWKLLEMMEDCAYSTQWK